jgi:hypothetical protein
MVVQVVHIVFEDIVGEPTRIVGVYADPRTACIVRSYMQTCAKDAFVTDATPRYSYRAESKEVTE